jgi:ATP-dependent Lon protease
MSEDVSKWRFPDIIFNKFPFNISIENFEMIRTKYLKKYNKIKHTVVHTESKSGIVNGLWANNLGNGGIVPIECVFYPSSIFLELQLTGMQGNVMKESMNIAKNLAWKLTPQKRQKELLNYFKNTKCQGLHIHCPDGAIAKDGPSAGAAITISIYSLFNNVKINNNIAVTGEINLQGNITEVGGIDAKVFGGIKAGVTIFFYPFENEENIRNVKKKIMNCSNIIDKSKNMYSHTTAKWHSLERSVGECINTPNKVVSVKGYTFISLKNINDIFETPLRDYNIFESS